VADVHAYGSIHDYPHVDQEFMLHMVLALDAVYLEDRYKRLAEERKREQRNQKKGAGRQKQVIARSGR
jgi:hypothetical protein